MKKAFRAYGPGGCEKRWLGDNAETPDGWHDTIADALGAYIAPAKTKKPAPPTSNAAIDPPYADHAMGTLSAELKRRTGKGSRPGTKKVDLIATLEAFGLAP